MSSNNKEYYGKGIPYLNTEDIEGKFIVIEGTDGVGRSTQIAQIKKWLEFKGYGVYTTGLARSPLIGKLIEAAKKGHTLNVNTYSLLYLADFADRLEHEIIPALRSGFIVLADRYIYSSFVRAIVRGADKEWMKNIYSIALKPDLVIYLKIGIKDLIPRVINSINLSSNYWGAGSGEGMDYWESGMDLKLGNDFYDSFVKYQRRMLVEFDKISAENNFVTIDASSTSYKIENNIKEEIRKILT